jgi:hypothetical protein
LGGISQGLSGGLGGAAAGSAFGPVGTGVGGGLGLLTGLFGGGPTTTQNVPSDLAGARSSQINTLQGLLGGGASGGGLQSFFGNLNVNPSDLQRQSAGGISQYLNQPNPAQRALDTSMPSLQEILTPGTMNPQFAQDLSLANQQGSRFGSGNEIMRGEAFRNLFNQRNQAAQTLGMLGQNANAANMGNLLQGYGVGQNQALQAAQGPNTYAALLSGLLGMRQQMVGGLPITTTPGLGQQIGQAGFGLADILRLLQPQGSAPSPAAGGGGGIET